MSIENNLASIAKSLETIAQALQAPVAAYAPVNIPAPVAAAPIVAPAPVVAPAPLPVAPAFTAPVETPAAPVTAPVTPAASAPFSDVKGLVAYVMASYKEMGAEKGARIQNVLTALGYQNINTVQPEHFAAVYAGVEALK